ncbi:MULTISPECIES: hypothetical protein [Nitrosomonas]|uniref:hypothetical protein n=1 Tax=Nitrosomonas TaxID=914 RepID=UPI003183D936
MFCYPELEAVDAAFEVAGAVFAVAVAAVSLPDSGVDFELGWGACLFLKSVTYQPVPFNWKPAADTFLT